MDQTMKDTLTEDDLYQHIFESKIFSNWHYYAYHFDYRRRGSDHPFAQSIVNACIDCNKKLPGFAKGFIDAIASISGREKYESHYEQLLQRISELHVIHKLLTYEWPFEAIFQWEPTTQTSKKKPELNIEGGSKTFGIEVKAPSLLSHIKILQSNPTQLSARNFTNDEIEQLPDAEKGITYPRDNPLKDFLISAESKFRPFKEENPEFSGVLVVVWDDFIYEPISALLHEKSGLFTPNSFDPDKNTFPNVDGVVLIRHLHQLMRAAGDRPLDYGRDGEYPPKVFISNPYGNGVSKSLLECLQAYTPSKEMGAEYSTSDLIWWS
ncbi:hypothetical protein [Candidatus Kuenenia stuttgartiensis]|nr:hypothetical protein [Candidatus Kuenenia stuttgartiensis]GJQ47847.1 MAG: hypothetical protein HKUEN01_02330 [Candidatus Kuenenia stuttgartiensis]